MGCFSQPCFRLYEEFPRTSPEGPRELQDHRESRHMLATLDLAHMRAFDACSMSQGFLRYSIFKP